MKKFNVAVLGSTGAVGREILSILEERNFPVKQLKCFSGEKSHGKKIHFMGKDIYAESLNESTDITADIIFGAVSKELSLKYMQRITQSSRVFIDNSSAMRGNFSVPLVIPEINPNDAFLHKGIIANPNCSTIIALTALAPIIRLLGIKSMTVTTYQAVSGAGFEGISQLEREIREHNDKKFCKKDNIYTSENTASMSGSFAYGTYSCTNSSGENFHNKNNFHSKKDGFYSKKDGFYNKKTVFPQQIVNNVIPVIGNILDCGYTDEEMKMYKETAKILHDNSIKVSCTCVRVPVVRCHSLSIVLETEKKPDISYIKQAYDSFSGAVYCEDYGRITPVSVSGSDNVYVGRLRNASVYENGLSLWCCGDQLRKGAALNAVQIAELLIKNNAV